MADPAWGTNRTGLDEHADLGENIQVFLRPAGDGGTQIEVTSSLKFGLVDWGRNNTNVARIHLAIDVELAQPWRPRLRSRRMAPRPVRSPRAPLMGRDAVDGIRRRPRGRLQRSTPPGVTRRA